MSKDIFEVILERAKKLNNKKIAFVECEDDRIIECAKKIVDTNLCIPVLVGYKSKFINKLKKAGIEHKVEIVDMETEPALTEKLVASLVEIRKAKGMTEEKAKQTLTLPIYYGAMLLQENYVDGIVAGCVLHSADVMRPVFQIIKQKKEIAKVSSCFLMELPENSKFGVDGAMFFADCAVIQYPNAEELASIALSTADTARKLYGFEPKVAMLSYSSNLVGETTDQSILNIKEAVKLVRQADKNIIIDGEIQADAAILEGVSERKYPGNLLQGKSNILVFPDINAGNIAYKLVQHITGKRAVGPIMQGLNKPVNDLSRSATADEIYLTTAITLLQI